MSEELEQSILKLTEDTSIDKGNVKDCACLIGSIISDFLSVKNIGIWVSNQGAIISPVFRLGNGSCNMSEVLALNSVQTYFSLMKQSHIQMFDQAKDIPDSELITKHIINCDMARSLHFMNSDNDVIVLIICELSDAAEPITEELTGFVNKLLQQLHRCATAKQLKEYSVLIHELEDQTTKSESMALLGSMVASLTHEINNPLGVAITGVSHMKSEVDSLLSSFNSGNLTEEVFQEFVDGCTEICSLLEFNLARTARLINGFKKTAVEQEAPSKMRFDICDCVTSLVSSLRPELKKHGIQININLDGSIYTEGYPGALSQIMTNLCFNSIKHAYEGIEKPEISIYGKFDSNINMYTLVYEDNGNGIPPEIQDSVFTAFFTTKRGKGGSGLGMALAKKQAREKLFGDIEIDKSYKSGARFLITLPLVD